MRGVVEIVEQAVARYGEAVGGAVVEVEVGDVGFERQVVECEEVLGGQASVVACLQVGPFSSPILQLEKLSPGRDISLSCHMSITQQVEEPAFQETSQDR